MSYRNTIKLAVLASGFAFLAAAEANATVLYSDLGTGSSVYDTGPGSIVKGSGAGGNSITQARPFTVAGSGAFLVNQIDLAVWNLVGVNTFTASIWTDSASRPGTQLGLWTLDATTYGSCCALATHGGITGVALTGGATYFMVLRPVSLSDNSDNFWQANTVGANSLVLGSLDGGKTWISDGTDTARAFDVLGVAAPPPPSVPEPASLLLLGTGLAGLFAAARKRRHQR